MFAGALLAAVCGPIAAIGVALTPGHDVPEAKKGSRVIWSHTHVYSGPLLPPSQHDSPTHRL